MQTPIIVMGAAGRMGATISRMVGENASLSLAGRVEQASRLGELFQIPGCVDSDDLETVLSTVRKGVIIDFTAPSLSVSTAKLAAEHGVAHVIGTTGLSELDVAAIAVCAKETPLFWSPNMSVGVAVLCKILPELVRMLGEGYDMELLEIHHNKKKDAPSGTALRLAEVMTKARGWNLKDVACCHREGIVGERPHKEMGLQTLRGGDVVGVHTAYFFGQGERIEVTHQAHSRDNFAQGALRVAEWLATQPAGRLYTMEDILD